MISTSRAGRRRTARATGISTRSRPISVPGYNTKGVLKFNDDNNRSPFNSDMNNFAAAHRHRVGDEQQDVHPDRLRPVLSAEPRHCVRPYGRGLQLNSNSTPSLDSNATLYAKLNNPYPGRDAAAPGQFARRQNVPRTRRGYHPRVNNRNPEYHSWNFSIQRELPLQSVVEVNYTGSRGAHLFLPVTSLSPLAPQYWSMGRTALNAIGAEPVLRPDHGSEGHQPEDPTIQQYRLLRPMPQFDGTNVGTAEPPRADSNYHALQVKWEKRFSKGLHHAGALHVVEDDRRRVVWLRQLRMARRQHLLQNLLGPSQRAGAIVA